MKVGDLVRCVIEGDYGIVVADQENNDGIYLIFFINGEEDYRVEEDVEVMNESR